MKKGFTLVELLGVIVLLGSLAVLVSYTITNVVKTTNANLDESTKKVLYTAADQYLDKNVELNSNGKYVVTVDKMIKSDIISSTFLDAQDKKKVTTSSCVTVTYVNGQSSYEFEYTCTATVSD